MVAVLTRVFGVHNLALVEDVVQDAFCRAVEVWRFRGMPENPSAWLMITAKRRALDVLRRERTARSFAPELGRLLETEWTLAPILDELFDPHAIQDDQLRLMFSCCHPRLPETTQVALVLHLLCGFTVSEVASAFVSTHAAMEKRLSRGKKVFVGSRALFEVRDTGDFLARLAAVQRALYLLFNEGYHSSSAEGGVRSELCREAIRLARLLIDHPVAAAPATYALAALLHLHGARLPARTDAAGELRSLFDQDRSCWDPALLNEGLRLLELSAGGNEVTEYHVEAAIASVHALSPSGRETDWGAIVSLYDTLMTLRPTPVVALNRAIAVGQHAGPKSGLEEMAKISDPRRLAAYPFYAAALGEFEIRSGRPEAARSHFRTALALARNPRERRFFSQRMSACDGAPEGRSAD
jgi:RNA polymerase sigma factor (sigma-70 family)